MSSARTIRIVRAFGLLRLAEVGRLPVFLWRNRHANRQFIRDHPDQPVPPASLAFDAYGHVHWPGYWASGIHQAELIAGIIRARLDVSPISVLEWGCGPGRVIRHLPTALDGLDPHVIGSDYNPKTIAWCQENLPGITFVRNGLQPPLPLPDDSIDAAYCLSVFTHLSGDAQIAWAQELHRVLKPGGLLICTTHGERHRRLLATQDEHDRFAAGEVVVQSQYAEGKKWFLALHPEPFVRNRLLAPFEDVTLLDIPVEFGFEQDIWTARAPDW